MKKVIEILNAELVKNINYVEKIQEEYGMDVELSFDDELNEENYNGEDILLLHLVDDDSECLVWRRRDDEGMDDEYFEEMMNADCEVTCCCYYVNGEFKNNVEEIVG